MFGDAPTRVHHPTTVENIDDDNDDDDELGDLVITPSNEPTVAEEFTGGEASVEQQPEESEETSEPAVDSDEDINAKIDAAIATVEQIDKLKIKCGDYPKPRAYLYAPNGDATGLPLVVYIHGGGWVSGSSSDVEWYAKLISSRGYAVANLDYSLAPDYTYPVSTIQLVTVINYLYAHAEEYGYDKGKIFIAGNSSGAYLASQLGAVYTDADYAKEVGVKTKVPAECIRGIILYNGVYNFSTAPSCHFPHYKDFIKAYTGSKNYKNYEKFSEMSTVNHISENYPPVFITVGDDDPLAPQTKEFIEALEDKGVEYSKLLWDDADLGHDYIFDKGTDEAYKAFRKTIKFIKAHKTDEEE